jgi:CRP/FNR family transcriptional regulator, cyclic AMP receptor protein
VSGNLTLEQIINFLLDAPMFGDLDATELSQIVQIMQVQGLRPGAFVFREGDAGDAWYLVYDGEVEVYKEPQGNKRTIAHLGRRACFGEMAILDGSSRSATVVATTEVTAFRFPRLDFSELIRSNNLAAYKLVYQMSLVLVSRQRHTTSRLVELLADVDPAALHDAIAPIVDQSLVAE